MRTCCRLLYDLSLSSETGLTIADSTYCSWVSYASNKFTPSHSSSSGFLAAFGIVFYRIRWIEVWGSSTSRELCLLKDNMFGGCTSTRWLAPESCW